MSATPWMIAFSTSGWVISFGTMQCWKRSSTSVSHAKRSSKRSDWISRYFSSSSSSSSSVMNLSPDIPARRSAARFVAIEATCGTWFVTPSHFTLSSVLYRKCGLSCACIIDSCSSFISLSRCTECSRFWRYSRVMRLKLAVSLPISSLRSLTSSVSYSPFSTLPIALSSSFTGFER